MPINEKNLIEDLSQMVRIPSVNSFGNDDPANPAEADMADFYEAKLKELGLEMGSAEVENGRRNIWGRLKGKGDGPTVMLAGHLDTVGVAGYETSFEPEIKDGRIHGRGSCDMKAGLAAYLEVVRILIESKEELSGDLIIAGVVDEEHGMTGSKQFGESGPSVDYAIVAEPSSLAISTAHRGEVCMGIRTSGLSAHSSMPENGINAIYHMSLIIETLKQYAVDLSHREPDPICGLPAFSIGVINGGENVSSVADWCEIEIDRRLIPGETYESYRKELIAILDPLSKEIPNFEYELVEPSLITPPLKTDMNSPIVKAIVAAYKRVSNKEPEFITFPGSTDAPNFGCPSVICGAGALEQAHSINEFVPISEMKTAVAIYLETIRTLMK